jgi:predicted RNA-binding protein with TRAM domain
VRRKRSHRLRANAGDDLAFHINQTGAEGDGEMQVLEYVLSRVQESFSADEFRHLPTRIT